MLWALEARGQARVLGVMHNTAYEYSVGSIDALNTVWRRGAHAVWIERDGKLRVKTANDARGDRPWTGGD